MVASLAPRQSSEELVGRPDPMDAASVSGPSGTTSTYQGTALGKATGTE